MIHPSQYRPLFQLDRTIPLRIYLQPHGQKWDSSRVPYSRRRHVNEMGIKELRSLRSRIAPLAAASPCRIPKKLLLTFARRTGAPVLQENTSPKGDCPMKSVPRSPRLSF